MRGASTGGASTGGASEGGASEEGASTGGASEGEASEAASEGDKLLRQELISATRYVSHSVSHLVTHSH